LKFYKAPLRKGADTKVILKEVTVIELSGGTKVASKVSIYFEGPTVPLSLTSYIIAFYSAPRNTLATVPADVEHNLTKQNVFRPLFTKEDGVRCGGVWPSKQKKPN